MSQVKKGQWYRWKDSAKMGEVISVDDFTVGLQFAGKVTEVSKYTLKLDWEQIEKPGNLLVLKEK